MNQVDPLNLKMNRKGFGLRKEIRDEVKGIYASDLINQIKANGFQKTFGRVTIHLAKEFGFCYGVDRAVELAYETRKNYPHKKVYLTTEIIHNPTVNNDLLELGVKFLNGSHKNSSFSDVEAGDVVIVPAFGTTVGELKDLYEKGCELIDTICGSVVVVWKRVEKYAKEGFTSLIHGKYNHEETQATSSRVLEFPKGRYIIVFNEEEADYVCRYIQNGGDKNEFMEKFKKAVSPDFDPDTDLAKIGLANQTTMLSSESLRIAHKVKKVLIEKFGKEQIDQHFMSFDTICSATQERQDAMINMKNLNLDLMLVVGGYNSSNTTHLQEIAMSFTKSYHINKPECIMSADEIKHKPFGKRDEQRTRSWLPSGEIHIGITAGASTPNKVMGDVLKQVIEFSNH